ncbi:MAG: hypothetical protein U1E27_03755 [Kiritimatiellia bacterium]|nr:hypothetical protein [Kiritimatiellia bacterium]
MRIITDTHGHLYPDQDPVRLLRGARDRLDDLTRKHHPDETPETTRRVFCLTERADCAAFHKLSEGSETFSGLTVVRCPADSEALRVLFPDGPDLWICSGRQFSTEERIEALAIGARPDAPDGLPLAETLRIIREADAVAVLPWAAGKWMGARGRRIRSLIQDCSNDAFLLGDSSLRPRGGFCGGLLRLGCAKGFRVVAGTDPLPGPGEEESAGAYATSLSGDWDDARPARSLVRLLLDPRTDLIPVGPRNTPLRFACRWIRARR